MLTKKEKKEMLHDSRKINRKYDFRKSKNISVNKYVSLDSYIQFVDDIQQINGPFKISKAPTREHNNKL